VNLFFVLSGFLITGILLETKQKPDYFRRFYTRRALRILPAYYAVLVILCIVPHTRWFMDRHNTWQFTLLSIFFMSNLTTLFGVNMQYGVFWSLAVEEHFYLVWPFIVKKLSKTSIIVCACLIVLVMPIFRALTFMWGFSEGYGYTWLVADGLALGSLLAVLLRTAHSDRLVARYFSITCILASIFLLIVGGPSRVLHIGNIVGVSLRLSVVNLLFAGMFSAILLIGTGPYRFLVRWRVLEFFGRISYGLYLIHMLSFDFANTIFATYFPGATLQSNFALVGLRFLLASGPAIVIAYLSRRYFEEWFLQLKRSAKNDASIGFLQRNKEMVSPG
ncbi:MAG TPA: acyltransferase, partial [Terriglobales bacterium]|nr:acyltransferase [Terriglobales bacterium]